MTNDRAKIIATRHILVVDDNEDALLVLGMLLQLKGYAVETCTSGQQALDQVAVNPPEIILLDISMPDMDGYETCRRLRQQPWGHTGLIIALTGYGQVETIQRAYETGFDNYLIKPVDLEELTSLLKQRYL